MNCWDDVVGSILEPVLDLDPRIGAGLQGCSLEDVAMIEMKFGLTLPPAFVALLARIGRNRGHLLRGADFGYPEILRYRENAESVLAGSELSLDPLDFVFEMEQGTQFLFFRAGTSDDPAVSLCNPDDPGFVALGLSLTAWLRVCMNEEMELWKRALAWEAQGHSLRAAFPEANEPPPARPWWKLW